MQEAGFIFDTEYAMKRYAQKLLEKQRVKRAVMVAFQKQLKLSNMDESEFGLKRIQKMHATIEKVVEKLTHTINNKKSGVTKEDIDPLVALLELNKQIVEKTGEWLGYDKEEVAETSLSLKLKGREPFGGFLPEARNDIPETDPQEITGLASVCPPGSPEETDVPIDAGELSFDSVLKTELVEKVKKEKKDDVQDDTQRQENTNTPIIAENGHPQATSEATRETENSNRYEENGAGQGVEVEVDRDEQACFGPVSTTESGHPQTQT